MPSIPRQLDHLVFAAPDLSAGTARLEERLGVRCIPGGRHPAWGTRNNLLPLGPTRYLEVIGPDSESPADPPPTLFGIATLPALTLVTWAAKGKALLRFTNRARAHGIELGKPIAGSRLRGDGTALRWELTDPMQPRAGGVIPFFIDWPDHDHPASLAPAEVELVDFTARHPDPHGVAEQLRFLGIDLAITGGSVPLLTATFRTATGTVILT